MRRVTGGDDEINRCRLPCLLDWLGSRSEIKKNGLWNPVFRGKPSSGLEYFRLWLLPCASRIGRDPVFVAAEVVKSAIFVTEYFQDRRRFSHEFVIHLDSRAKFA